MRADTTLFGLVLLVFAGACVPQDGARIDPRETFSQRAAVPEVIGRRASARLEPLGRQSLRGTVFLRESAEDLAIEAVVASVDPGNYRLVARDGVDCSRPAAAAVFGAAPDATTTPPGDLGVLEVGEDGAGRLALVTTHLSLEPGSGGLVGRIVTLAPDGLEAEPLACGVVEAER